MGPTPASKILSCSAHLKPNSKNLPPPGSNPTAHILDIGEWLGAGGIGQVRGGILCSDFGRFPAPREKRCTPYRRPEEAYPGGGHQASRPERGLGRFFTLRTSFAVAVSTAGLCTRLRVKVVVLASQWLCTRLGCVALQALLPHGDGRGSPAPEG